MVAALAIDVSMASVIRFSLRLGIGQVDWIGVVDQLVARPVASFGSRSAWWRWSHPRTFLRPPCVQERCRCDVEVGPLGVTSAGVETRKRVFRDVGVLVCASMG
jgi:hypothetical protein